MLKMDPQVVGKSNTTFKLKRGKKIFHIKVEDSEADDGDAEAVAGELEKSLLGQVLSRPPPAAEGKKQRNTPRRTALSSVVVSTPMDQGSFAESSEQRRWMNAKLCAKMPTYVSYA